MKKQIMSIPCIHKFYMFREKEMPLPFFRRPTLLEMLKIDGSQLELFETHYSKASLVIEHTNICFFFITAHSGLSFTKFPVFDWLIIIPALILQYVASPEI